MHTRFLSQRMRQIITLGLFCAVLLSALSVSAQDVPGVNDQPDITLPSPAPDTTLGVAVGFVPVVSDVDVGSGNMELEIDIFDLDGAGGRSVAAGDYGTFSWGLGSGVTSDTGLTTLANLNSALTTFTYTPPVGFAGTARIIFEIDDQGNTGTGGVLSRTRFIDIDVCAPVELGTAACDANNQPDVSLSGSGATAINTSLPIAVSVSDVDAGTCELDLEIDISDLDGVGGLSVPAGDYGTFTWGGGVGVTSDISVNTLVDLNTFLTTFTYTPDTGFTGTARIVFEIDDNGCSGAALPLTELSRTRFIDITVAAATNTPTSTPTSTATVTSSLVTVTSTSTATSTNTPETPTSTPTDTSTGTPETPTSTTTATATATPDTPTSTPTATATATTVGATNTPTATSTIIVLTPTATLEPDPVCVVRLPIGAVQGRMKVAALAFYAPDPATMTTVLLPTGSTWFIIDEQNGFYQLHIACQANPVWIPQELMEPNYDAVWLGAALP